jgi:3alpha(or 20beta)-hydroxysteroid dehydrogenase
MSGRLEGKVALVTGAARGMGEAFARKLAEHGAKVAVADIQVERGQRTAQEIGDGAIFVELDVRRPEAWDTAVAKTLEAFGRLDILVNNAGAGTGTGPVDKETLEGHQAILALNVTGVWNGIRAVTPVMTEQGAGSIVNISSIDGLAGVRGVATYATSKFAVTGLTRSSALDLGARGIRINSIHPGIIATPAVLNSGILPRLQTITERQPIARIGRPEEVANAVLFFASDESSYCTGASLLVDGGHLAGPYRDPHAHNT